LVDDADALLAYRDGLLLFLGDDVPVQLRPPGFAPLGADEQPLLTAGHRLVDPAGGRLVAEGAFPAQGLLVTERVPPAELLLRFVPGPGFVPGLTGARLLPEAGPVLLEPGPLLLEAGLRRGRRPCRQPGAPAVGVRRGRRGFAGLF